MLLRMLFQSWKNGLRRKFLAIFTIFLAAGLISALLAVSIDIGDKMAKELKSYGANILIEPAAQAALPDFSTESTQDATKRNTLIYLMITFLIKKSCRISRIFFGAIISSVLHRN